MAVRQEYEVVVGNIGTVYHGGSSRVAWGRYNDYVTASEAEYGRASGELVTLLCDGDVLAEHQGLMDEQWNTLAPDQE